MVRKGRIPEKYLFKGFSGVSSLVKIGEILGEIVREHGRMIEGEEGLSIRNNHSVPEGRGQERGGVLIKWRFDVG